MKSVKIPSKYVDKNVDENPKSTLKESSSKSKKKSPWKKGKYPCTVFNKETKTLFVRKTVLVNRFVTNPKTGERKFVKQRQIWRACPENTKESALEVLREIEDEINFARSGKAQPLIRFDEIAERFQEIELIPAVFQNGKKIAGKIEIETPRRFVKYFIEHFGPQAIDTITYDQIQEYKQFRLKTPIKKLVKVKTEIPEEKRKGKAKFKTKKVLKSSPRAIRSVNYELTVLKQIFNFAIRNKWIKENPFNDGKPLIDSSQENKRYKTWTKIEEEQALALCKDQNLHMKPVIICLVDGGFRKGELLKATWQDVDFKNEYIKAKSYKGKTLIVRPVFMTKRMKAALLDWKKAQKKVKKITNKNLVIGYQDIKHGWENIRKQIGREDLTLHDLRHVFATRLNNQKTPIRDVSLLLGHSKIETTIRYINPTDDRLRNAVQSLETFED